MGQAGTSTTCHAEGSHTGVRQPAGKVAGSAARAVFGGKRSGCALQQFQECLLWTNAFLLSWVPELTAPFSHTWLYPEDELAALVFHFQSGCHTKC